MAEWGAGNVSILPVGNKSIQAAPKTGAELLTKEYGGVFRKVTISLAEQLTHDIIKRFDQDGYQRVVMVFNKFKNVLIQEVTEWQILPLVREAPDETAGGVEHLAEPSLQQILDDLSPRVVTTRVYQALMESCAAEHAARMTAMDAATNNAKDMISQLTLEMNKARQAAITTELIEVVSGAARTLTRRIRGVQDGKQRKSDSGDWSGTRRGVRRPPARYFERRSRDHARRRRGRHHDRDR